MCTFRCEEKRPTDIATMLEDKIVNMYQLLTGKY